MNYSHLDESILTVTQMVRCRSGVMGPAGSKAGDFLRYEGPRACTCGHPSPSTAPTDSSGAGPGRPSGLCRQGIQGPASPRSALEGGAGSGRPTAVDA